MLALIPKLFSLHGAENILEPLLNVIWASFIVYAISNLPDFIAISFFKFGLSKRKSFIFLINLVLCPLIGVTTITFVLGYNIQ